MLSHDGFPLRQLFLGWNNITASDVRILCQALGQGVGPVEHQSVAAATAAFGSSAFVLGSAQFAADPAVLAAQAAVRGELTPAEILEWHAQERKHQYDLAVEAALTEFYEKYAVEDLDSDLPKASAVWPLVTRSEQ